jgi:hypothetical protein
VHIENQEAIPRGGYIFDQLKDLMANGITCHGLACSYHLVTRGEASTIGKNNCPWYTTTKPHSTNLTLQISLTTAYIISSIGKKYYMQKSLI